MTTISIPFFSLSDTEQADSSSRNVWNEIKVPVSDDIKQSTVGCDRRPIGVSDASQTSAACEAILGSSLSPQTLPEPTRLSRQDAYERSGQVRPAVANPVSLSNSTTGKTLNKLANLAHQPSQVIERLAACILERFPLAAPSIVLFSGTESNPQTSATCANVANALAKKNIGRILLVDSSSTRELTKCYHLDDRRGLSNLLIDANGWQSSLIQLPSSGLEFLPAGSSHWEHWGAENRLRQLAGEMRRQYQYICVAADDPQLTNSKIWATVCDGSFLLVSMKNANPLIAESAVVELQSSGARLLGCVVTDSDTALP